MELSNSNIKKFLVCQETETPKIFLKKKSFSYISEKWNSYILGNRIF